MVYGDKITKAVTLSQKLWHQQFWSKIGKIGNQWIVTFDLISNSIPDFLKLGCMSISNKQDKYIYLYIMHKFHKLQILLIHFTLVPS